VAAVAVSLVVIGVFIIWRYFVEKKEDKKEEALKHKMFN